MKNIFSKAYIKDSSEFVLHGDKVICHYDIPEDFWLVDIDQGQMSQMIQNMVLNASQAMPEGGIVNIKCEILASARKTFLPFAKYDRFVKVCVKDSGHILVDSSPGIGGTFFIYIPASEKTKTKAEIINRDQGILSGENTGHGR